MDNLDAKIFLKMDAFQEELKLKTNFNYKRIMVLPNLSSLNIYQLYELKNYKTKFILTEINLQILKLFSFPYIYC